MKNSARSLIVMAAVVLALAAPAAIAATHNWNADVVLVTPAGNASQHAAILSTVAAWRAYRQAEGYVFDSVPLYEVAAAAGKSMAALAPEDIRLFLRRNFSATRAAATAKGRYLALLGDDQLFDNTLSDDALIPRYKVPIVSPYASEVQTDYLYGLLVPPAINVSQITNVSLAYPSFLVFRIPARNVNQLRAMLAKAVRYESAPYRRHLNLVAGSIVTRGDAAAVQYLNALIVQRATRKRKVFDTPYGGPDYVVTDNNHRLYHFMQNAALYSGGVDFNLSHGSASAVYAMATNGGFIQSLKTADVPALSTNKLNVFISFACLNDQPLTNGLNLAKTLMNRQSVAVAASTIATTPTLMNIRIAELGFLPAWFDRNNTLLQAAQSVRDRYIQRFMAAPAADRMAHIANVLGLNLYGDGMLRLR